jgi:peptidoglycan hydrolase-like protein with peptidoglycan-binding domain
LIQAKLNLRKPGDALEREADRVAKAVMRMPQPTVRETPAASLPASLPEVQRSCADCEEGFARTSETPVRRKEQAAATPLVTPAVATNIRALRRGGEALPDATRAFFEPRFGADFSGVRVHTGMQADEAATAIGAKAFTMGNDISFAKGQYSPQSGEGRELLAHELTHTIQQAGPGVLERKIGDGHDLTSPRFAGEEELEAAFDDKKESIRIGHRGAKVTKIQIALTDHAINVAGLPNSLPRFGEDGIFGPETKAAVQAFQAKMGLPKSEQDGIVGPTTMDLLDKQFPPKAGSPHSLPVRRPADKKVVNVNFTVLFGCTKSVSNAVNVANVLYSPANIEIKAGKIQQLSKAQSEALIGTDLILSEHKFTTPTNDERALFSVNQQEGVVSAYFVKDIRDEVPDVGPSHGGDNGYAIGPPEEDFGFTGVAIQNAADDKTFAHELGHLLRGFGHVTTDPNALMAPGGVGTQFSAEEIATMRQSPFAKSSQKAP